MKIFLRVVACLLFLIALMTGGCSLVFATGVPPDDPTRSGIWPFVHAGFAIGGLCLSAGTFLWWITRRSVPKPGPDTFR